MEYTELECREVELHDHQKSGSPIVNFSMTFIVRHLVAEILAR